MEACLVYDSFEIFRSETRCLLIDDDFIYLDSLAEILKYFSYKVTLAKSGQDALSLLSDGSQKFDIVLIDGGLFNANLFFFFQQPVIKEVPFISMGSDSEYSVAATETLRNGAYFYMKKPIALESIKSLWGHAMAAKFPKSNVKDNGKRVLQINPQEENETVNYENNKAAKGKEIAINGTIDGVGTNELARTRSWRAPFTSNTYQFGREGCTSNNLEMLNYEPRPALQVASPVQGLRINGSMPVDIPQQLPSQENERALMEYQPLAENHADNDAYLKNYFLNDGIIDASLEDIAPLPQNFGMIDTGMLEEGIDNSTLQINPNSNELMINNNQLPPPVMEDEILPSWINSLLFDNEFGDDGFEF